MTLIETLTLFAAISPVAASLGYIGIRWAVRPLELKLETHIVEDAIVQPLIKESLIRLETKVDKLVDRWLTCASERDGLH